MWPSFHDNHVIGEPKIECESDKVAVRVRTQNTFM